MTGSPLADVFNATSSDFDAVTPAIWGPAAQAMVAAVQVSDGERVLDICSGTGASALAAARRVGPDGAVVAVDFAADLVERARINAGASGLSAIDFRVADVTELPAGDDRDFDVLLCGYGVFFLPDMDNTVRALLGVLRPGGRLGFAVWHDGALRDFAATYFAEVGRVKGEALQSGWRTPSNSPPNPITRIDTVDKITAWLESLDAVNVTATVLRLQVPRTDEFSWAMVLGSGFRGALRGMTDDDVADVRAGFLRRLAADGMTVVDCDTIIVTAERADDNGGDHG